MESEREHLVRLLSAVTFLIFFQAYMVAPLIPRLSEEFRVSPRQIGFVIPVYLIPYGVSTLFYGVLSDRIGRRRVIVSSLFTFVTLTALTATSQSATQMLTWRLFTGLGASGVVSLALALIGQLFSLSRAWEATGLVIRSNGRRRGIRLDFRSLVGTLNWLAIPISTG